MTLCNFINDNDRRFRDVVMKCKCLKIFAGNQNQAYRSLMKTLLLKEQT